MVDPLHLRIVLRKHFSDKSYRFDELAVSYDQLEWFDSSPKPSPEEINKLYNNIVDNAWKNEHVNMRTVEYPSTDELIVALWEKLVEQDGLSSDKIDRLQQLRQEIKQRYPKLLKKRETPPLPVVNPGEPDKFA